ncbi:hypothetical protein CVIRNUC_008702 [Coccomyxa viridis]|uniref:Protein kinase domain-containing protein n=1 Tax=Coccomyxa viridis TaxID=1274662 RepID=A0AAV1IDV6_9CHLO|nr:hypothetical protein CVIRNUC_008702 [Coccomyxa viridis]
MFGTGNSNDAKIRLLERRLRGDTPSPRHINRAQSMGEDVSGDGFPVACLPFGISPTGPSAAAGSEESEAAETSRGGFSIRSRQLEPDTLKRKLSASGSMQPPAEPARKQQRSVSPAPPLAKGRMGKPPLHETATEISPAPGKGQQKTPTGSRTQQAAHRRNTMTKYFPVLHDPGHSNESFPCRERLVPMQPLRMQGLVSKVDAGCQTEGSWTAMAEQLQEAKAEGSALQKEVSSLRWDMDDLKGRLTCAQSDAESSRSRSEHLQQQLDKASSAAAAAEARARAQLQRLALAAARREREAADLRLQDDARRLGCLTVARAGPIGLRETWEDGRAFKELAQRRAAVADAKEGIETARKAMRKKLPPPENTLSQPSQQSQQQQQQDYLAPEDYVVQDEIFKVRLAALKREEDALQREKERLEAEKERHFRELKRLKDEEGSRFKDNPVLAERYLLLRLLGKGGFSEVFQAYDLEGMREVAVKIHQLNSAWHESKKASYVRHAVREYNIHKSLRHARVVGLLDIFEIDVNTFATVLELCRGRDLDAHLKDHQALPEKEAKAITLQIVQGLAYLNEAPRHIIHYDLKPANILFDSFGQAKITDFGLSKIVEEGHSRGLELTSQGAGTYWYLPPECFEVDVWAVGVMLYQMLFGRRPFGEGCSQEEILRNEVMLKAHSVAFPAKPAISAECKDFITRCLAYRQADRLDVAAAAAQPFLAMKRTGARQSGAAAASPATGQKS